MFLAMLMFPVCARERRPQVSALMPGCAAMYLPVRDGKGLVGWFFNVAG